MGYFSPVGGGSSVVGNSNFQGALEVVGQLTASGGISTLNVAGLSSLTGDLEFTDAEGYELTVERLIVPSDGFVDLRDGWI